MLPGVYLARRKNGEVYYRSSITYRGKHISIGSFSSEVAAHRTYLDASKLLHSPHVRLEDYGNVKPRLSFAKWVSLVNFRDNGLYVKTPIYLKKHCFLYYLDEKTTLVFDVDDLFYYSSHSIIQRNGRLFVCDFGMQVSLLSRYGVRSYAVAGRDYRFVNGNPYDFRYGNIEVIHKYHGVTRCVKNGTPHFTTRIHIKGYTVVGRYGTESEAAIAYNKAVLLLKENGLKKDFPMNYIEEIDSQTYQDMFEHVKVSKKISGFHR